MDNLKVFKGEYNLFGNYGAYEAKSYIIIANNETEALGVALERVKTSKKKHWEIEEIDTSIVGAHWVSSDFN